MKKEALVEQLKVQIIEALYIEDMQSEAIDPAGPLFGEGLGLDSIDALELILLLERDYGIKIDDPQTRRDVLVSINTMADFILAHQS
jgi:acyl carrier protein